MTVRGVFTCCDERRRAAVDDHPTLNGIDYLEVVDRDWVALGIPEALRQRVLRVHFINPPSAALLSAASGGDLVVRIDGGVRVRDIAVTKLQFITVLGEKVLEVRTSERGDFSTYTLQLLDSSDKPFPGLDPILASVDFSFKVECEDDFDCRPARAPAEARREAPAIDYLAKDYASFRRAMLERMALLLPWWQESHAADAGVTIVELLAYVADHLSYEQDAVATEAYLATARRRVSVRRHARLVDYAMHDGCNARVWLRILLEDGVAALALPQGARVYTAVAGLPERVAPDATDARMLGEDEVRLLDAGAAGFETMEDATLFSAHDELLFYAWGQRECCLPRGATRATLAGKIQTLVPGMVLIFEEIVSPSTGLAADADPARRHAVRLTKVELAEDPLGGRFEDPKHDGAAGVTEIEWAPADALPFPLCISAITGEEHGSAYVEPVSVARGNVVLADHGVTIAGEPLAPVPEPDRRLAALPTESCERCDPCAPAPAPARYRPRLARGPVTQAATLTRFEEGERRTLGFDPDAPASAAMSWDMDRVLPAVSLESTPGGWTWLPQRDLLSSDAFARDFVVEVEDDGGAALRFGDDRHGARPASSIVFHARYRVGNGAAGNVGAEAIRHVTSIDGRILGATNPMPAKGGVEPESMEHVRQSAPAAFRVPQRAVTPEDYARFAEKHREVQRAVATLRWTGSWRTVFLTVDRLGGRSVDAAFEAELREHLERYRMAGHDLEIDGPRFVSLELELSVCVAPEHYRSDVKRALLEVLGSRDVPGRGRGLFHPDNFTFAQPVYLSRLYAAAQAVPGVRSVRATKLQRLGVDDRRALDEGALEVGRLEIARLDNDPSFPEHGVLRLTMEGGR